MFVMKIFDLGWKGYVLILVCSKVQRKHGLSLPPIPYQLPSCLHKPTFRRDTWLLPYAISCHVLCQNFTFKSDIIVS